MSTKRVTTIAIGKYQDDLLIAIVSADETHKIKTVSDLKEAVKVSVSEWIETTTAGQKAWENNSHDFNVGNLAEHLGDHALGEFLEHNGVTHLNIFVVLPSQHISEWNYNEVLFEN